MKHRNVVTYSMTNVELRKLQLIQTDMLLEVDRICREHSVNYSIAGGTLLGAVRHGGYIPWDDDADVVMLRSEYEHFREIAERELDPEKYYFQDHRNTEGYRWGYGKIRRRDTVFERAGQEHMPYEQCVCIDVFPLDSVPDGVCERYFHNLHCNIIRKILWSEVGRRTDKNALLRAVYGVLSLIPVRAVFGHYQRFINKYNKRMCKRLRPITFPVPKGYLDEGFIYWYDSYIDMTFEGHEVKAMVGFEAYLRLKYWNYMELPPENERKTHPVSRLKLI